MIMTIEDFMTVDTETTGVDAAQCELVEVAAVDHSGQVAYSSLVKPNGAIPIGAMAIHHITDDMVEDAPTAAEIESPLKSVLFGKTLVAHNAQYDSKVLERYGITNPPWNWICTWRLANHMWPDAPGYKNQELRYWLGLYEIDTQGLPPHRAAADAIVTSMIFRKLYDHFVTRWTAVDATADCTAADLIAFAARPIYIRKMPFGKHKGELIEDVPHDYLMWMIRKIPDLSDDLRYTVRRVLGLGNTP